MKLEEIIEQSLSLADQYGLEPAAGRKKRCAETVLSEGGHEGAETGERVEMKK
ncbi:MAG: hypothetical protein ACRD3I_00215 [Terriglobales bacterium]